MFCDRVATDVNVSVHQWHFLPTWNPMAQVIVLLTRIRAADELELDVDAVLRNLHAFGMLNVNVLAVAENTSVVLVFTWHPYGSGNCANVVRDIVVADRCEYETEADTPIHYEPHRRVAKIPATLNWCPLRVAASAWEPYVVFDKATDRFSRGIEVLLITTIAAVLHLRPQFVRTATNRENRMAGQTNDVYVQLANRCVYTFFFSSPSSFLCVAVCAGMFAC